MDGWMDGMGRIDGMRWMDGMNHISTIVVLFRMALVRAWPKNSKSYKLAQHELSQAHITWHLQKTC